MLNYLTKSFSKIIKSIRGEVYLTESNISEILREIRFSLLEADVSLQVIRNFIENIKKKYIGKKIINSLTPGQILVSIVQKELSNIMSGNFNSLEKKINFNVSLPTIILIVGLQGCGKTTTTAKLARYLKIYKKKKVLTVSVDIYRPAAFNQLKILSNQIKVDFFESKKNKNPIDIAIEAVNYSKNFQYDVLIIDTAGRSSINNIMMQEIKSINNIIKPNETLFIVDSMLGQDAINTAKIFNNYLSLSGIILTKLDSDTRGGCALSITYIVGKPIKFIGISEKIDGLEVFNSEIMSKRILGMENILSLVENIKKELSFNSSKKKNNKKYNNKRFDLNDFKLQIIEIKRISSFSGFLINFIKQFKKNSVINENKVINQIKKAEYIINSMTKKERKFPNIIKASRKKRIALGSGMKVQDVNQLLFQFNQFKMMMKKYGNLSSNKILNNIKDILN